CYDFFGNLTEEIYYGFADVTGDETTALYEYKPNITSIVQGYAAYLVGYQAHSATYQGAGTTTLLTDTYNYYDGQTSWFAAPTAGFVTQSTNWLNTASAYVPTNFAYDSYGNLTTITDASSAVTQTFYDSTYTVYATEVRNPLYTTGTASGLKQRALTSWEDRC